MIARRDERLLDYLLGELEAGDAREVAASIARDDETARQRDLFRETLALIRSAAAPGWPASPARENRRRWLRPALAAAAVALVALGLMLLERGGLHGGQRDTIYEPDGAFGYLMPEEVDASGRVPQPARGDGFALRAGRAEVAAIGSERSWPLEPGAAIAADSELKTPAETGARVDLPGGGILFVGPLSTLALRLHGDGGAALRLIDGEACTVAGAAPLHLAIDRSDLLLDQPSGAALLRHAPSEAICLRGELYLRTADGGRFAIPEQRRLPAACANQPRTVEAREDEMTLDWYWSLAYGDRNHRDEPVEWERPGRSQPLRFDETKTLLYLRIVPRRSDRMVLSFGGKPRTFSLHAGRPLRLRLRLGDLGPGPRLQVEPAAAAAAVREARLYEAE